MDQQPFLNWTWLGLADPESCCFIPEPTFCLIHLDAKAQRGRGRLDSWSRAPPCLLWAPLTSSHPKTQPGAPQLCPENWGQVVKMNFRSKLKDIGGEAGSRTIALSPLSWGEEVAKGEGHGYDSLWDGSSAATQQSHRTLTWGAQRPLVESQGALVWVFHWVISSCITLSALLLHSVLLEVQDFLRTGLKSSPSPHMPEAAAATFAPSTITHPNDTEFRTATPLPLELHRAAPK